MAYITKNNSDSFGNKYQLIDGEVYRKERFHKFFLGDVDELDLYAGYTVNDWLETNEKGRWVKEHVRNLTMTTFAEPWNFGHCIVITGLVTARHWTFFLLKYNDTIT